MGPITENQLIGQVNQQLLEYGRGSFRSAEIWLFCCRLQIYPKYKDNKIWPNFRDLQLLCLHPLIRNVQTSQCISFRNEKSKEVFWDRIMYAVNDAIVFIKKNGLSQRKFQNADNLTLTICYEQYFIFHLYFFTLIKFYEVSDRC